MTAMERRAYGNTGLEISVLGFGAGRIGESDLTDREAEAVLNQVLDLGVNLIDTARSYGASEARIGRVLAHRRREIVLSTKGGYGVAGVRDWTGKAVRLGIERALQVFSTDVIDVFHLHSCPLEVLRRDDVLEALAGAVADGKVRVAAYSGENVALRWAATSGRFAGLQSSINLFDQGALDEVVPAAAARGIGVLAKRALANAVWRYASRPSEPDTATYWDRMHAIDPVTDGLEWDELAVRFAAFAPGVAGVLVGSTDAGHVARNAALVARGPLPADVVRRIRDAYRAVGHGWPGVV